MTPSSTGTPARKMEPRPFVALHAATDDGASAVRRARDGRGLSSSKGASGAKAPRMPHPLVARFIESLRARNLSERTLVAYERDIAQFLDHLADAGKLECFPGSLRRIDFRAWLAGLSGAGAARSTQARKLAALRSLYRYLVRNGEVETNPLAAVRSPRAGRTLPGFLSVEEVEQMLRAVGDASDWRVARDRAMIETLYGGGLRVSELVGLDDADVDTVSGILRVKGKGKKERIVPMGSNAQRALQRYLFRYRPKPFNQGIENVFLSVMGKQLTDNSVKLIFSRLSKRSGVSRLHAHLCRHTFATRFLINGGDVFTLQQILGHSTLEMVRHYVNLASNHVAIQHQKFSPLDRLDLRK